MARGGLMDDVEKSYQGLKETIQTLGELREATRKTRLGVDSIIDYNVNDALNTLLPMSDYVEIQIGDVSEDVRRNAVVNVRNFTRDMDFDDVKDVILDYDGNVELGEIFHYFDLDNLIIRNVDIFSWYNVLPNCTVGTIRFENCELAQRYSVRTISDNCETSLDFIFEGTNSIGKIECVNCSEEFVDVLMLGIDKIDDNHRFGNIEIEIK
jgi:hypothetical protein